MIIKKATLGDINTINVIYNQAVAKKYCTAHLEPVSLEERISWFFKYDPERFPVFILEEEGAVKGWISLRPYRENRRALGHVAEVSYYVHNEFQGRGAGTALMEYAIKESQRFGFTVLIAILLDRNKASIALLNKFGFKKWGCMPGIARINGEKVDHLYYGLNI